MIRHSLTLSVALVVSLTSATAAAQTYPIRPVKLVVGFAPGGSTDIAARALAGTLTVSLGQSVIVENRAGAASNLGSEYVARAAPDGYTLLMATTSIASAPAFFSKLTWDPVKDFTPISLVATVPIMAVVHPSVSANTPQELVAYSKANPGKLNLGSPGATTLTRLSAELFKQRAGLDWVTVHYKGGGQALQDLLGGNVQVMFASISEVIGHVNAGKLKAIAVTTPARSPIAPGVPTFAESGFPDFSFSAWQAVVGPAGLPQEVVTRLNAEIVRVMKTPELKERFAAIGTDVSTGAPDQLARLIEGEVVKIRRIAETLGEKPQ